MSQWDDESDEVEWSQDEDDNTSVIPCPQCGTDIYEEADQCPNCGEFLIANSHPLQGKPIWFLLIGLAGIIAVILAFSGLLR